MSISVRVTNNTRRVRATVNQRVDRAIRAAAFQIEGHAKAGAPVDTGNLRNSINASGHDSEWRVDSPAEYSIYQEFGTRYQAAQPYMVPAVERVRPALMAALRRIA